MNNNLILEANELFKKSALTANQTLFVEAINKISAQIAIAINPLTPANRPFIAAVMMRYVNFIKKDFDPEETDVYSAMLKCLSNEGAEYIMTIPVSTKGDKPNG